MSECGPTKEDHVARHDDDGEMELQEQIRRFPELFPTSMGGTGPEPKDSDPRLTRPMPDEEDFGEGDDLGVHATDNGDDTFDEREAEFVLEDLNDEVFKKD
jgi:hypothetical protein